MWNKITSLSPYVYCHSATRPAGHAHQILVAGGWGWGVNSVVVDKWIKRLAQLGCAAQVDDGRSNCLHRAHFVPPPSTDATFTCVADMPHRRRFRSASTEQLDVPTCRRSTIGGLTFPVAGAKVWWNGLPGDVTSASSLSLFKNRLKTYMYLFRRCYETDFELHFP